MNTKPNTQDVPLLIRTAPERIWLQVSDDTLDPEHDEFPANHGDVTWCDTPVLEQEVEYVRADLATYNTATHELVPKQGWLRAVDEEMVTTHLGVADANDNSSTAERKLHQLIQWHVAVATDPQVNGGFVLVPVTPTKEFWSSFSAYDGTSYSNPFDEDDFRSDWAKAVSSISSERAYDIVPKDQINLPDGRLELVPLGTREAVERVIADMKKGMALPDLYSEPCADAQCRTWADALQRALEGGR